MKQKRTKVSEGRLSARPLGWIAGLAACFAASVVTPVCHGQPAVRVPGPGAERARLRQGAVQIQGVMVTYLPNRASVRLSDMGSSTYRTGYWMKIMIQFASQPDWIDELRFDCYVLLRDGNRENLLTGSVTCSYVQRGTQHVTCLFVPPNTLEKHGNVRAIGVECYYDGTLVSDYSAPRTTRKWWEDYSGVSGTMVTWFYTPFLRDGIEQYEQVKPTADRR